MRHTKAFLDMKKHYEKISGQTMFGVGFYKGFNGALFSYEHITLNEYRELDNMIDKLQNVQSLKGGQDVF